MIRCIDTKLANSYISYIVRKLRRYLIGILSQTIQTKFYKIMNYPEAQDPDAVPPLLAHSFVVKQVPLRFRLE